ncbi:sn-glycerol-1-phosphate dehydrogenase [Domibacillus sp. PGB-M46]|uniref:sn-glycerol-1-phosphate dehydrogenase n=1 Tax=Domibacillus sp. PGB-M46 TaxID=2910255 RepID=UPI001F5A564B|nr:sn-glycerol-1-phosphate dehydrogenase [Domibacillus sp. PGB-M46]MCI2256944.1 sn-glycerol-1-phosphate dehydrogenase [Domibacillus sp. PGB-M46]
MKGTTIEKIVIEKDAFEQCAAYVQQKGWKNILIIADKNTQRAAGGMLSKCFLEKSLQVQTCLIEPDQNGDVKADEISIVQALIGIDAKTDVLVAVGSGTIHDITRFCSDKTGVPFVSIPTAPSVDGFTSVGAPIIVRGMKKTFKAVSPQALFADIKVLMKAPDEMIAAGFGDMLAKFTSLADWKFGHLTAKEPYSEEAALITERALNRCVKHVDSIAEKQEEGIRALMETLIESGIAMLKFGQSHPASGGEHHLSHYWEMNFIQENRPQVLHGAKVGAATALITRTYKERAEKLPCRAGVELIPDPDEIVRLLQRAGAPASPSELGIEPELVKASLRDAHTLRDRYTMLRYINENEIT